MGLDPGVVYCDLETYTLNFNIGLVKVDTATFYYEGLLSDPIRGKFEDRNVGIKTELKPTIPTSELRRGIVIEDLLPGVLRRGILLRGTRKIDLPMTYMKLQKYRAKARSLVRAHL